MVLKKNHEANKLFNETKQTVRGLCFVVSHNFRAPVSNLHSLIEIYDEEEDPSTKELLIEKLKQQLLTSIPH
jgi:signal transduction histidine kinase